MHPTSENIVTAQARHVDSIQACAAKAYQRYIPRMNKEPAPMLADFNKLVTEQKVVVALAETANDILGYAVFYPTQKGMHLENIAVLPSVQNRGVGRQLIDYVERQAETLGHSRVHLYTNVAMQENLEWYAQRGYQETERKSQDGYERIFFEKKLPQ